MKRTELTSATTYIQDLQGNVLAKFAGYWLTPVGGMIELDSVENGAGLGTIDLVVTAVHTKMRHTARKQVIVLTLRTQPAPRLHSQIAL